MYDANLCRPGADARPEDVADRGALPLRLVRVGHDDRQIELFRPSDAASPAAPDEPGRPARARVRGVRGERRKVNPKWTVAYHGDGVRVRRADLPSGPRFYAYVGKAMYLGAFGSLEEAIEAAETEGAKVRRARSESVVVRAIEKFSAIPVEVRRALFDDPDDPIAEFFARRKIRLSVLDIAAIYGFTKKVIYEAQERGERKIGSVDRLREAYVSRVSRPLTFQEELEAMADA